tara:strand:- start:162 stop:1253 length:1092 start_codon:yes stop_codon:yes gene_type:complete
MAKRIFYACQGVFIDGSELQNVQSVGVNYSAEAESISDQGRQQQFRSLYAKPEVEITIERNLNHGFTPFYAATTPSTYVGGFLLADGNLGMCGWDGSSNLKEYKVELVYMDDQDTSARVANIQYKYCLITNISYSFQVGGPATESITLKTHNLVREGTATVPVTGGTDSGTNIKRQAYIKPSDEDANSTVIPTELSSIITNDEHSGLIQSIEASLDISYEELSDQGTWRGANQTTNPSEQNKWKYVSDVDIETSITANLTKSIQQDILMKDTNFMGTFPKPDREIKLAFTNGASNFFVLDLGKRNYLTSISWSGGDTGGGNVTGAFTYKNDMKEFVPYVHSAVYNISVPTTTLPDGTTTNVYY